MKKLTAILLFLTFGIFGNAESMSSIIEKNLTEKGVKKVIITKESVTDKTKVKIEKEEK